MSLTKRWSEAGRLSQIVLAHALRQASVSLILDVRQNRNMTRNETLDLLQLAVAHARGVARTMVSDVLPNEVRFRIRENRPKPEPRTLTAEEMTDRIRNEDGILRWVDLAVYEADEHYTFIIADCASDRVASIEGTVYFSRGMGPFGIKSPNLPVGWKSTGESGTFKLKQ